MRALATLGHQIFVISGKPADYESAPEREGALELLEVPSTTSPSDNRTMPSDAPCLLMLRSSPETNICTVRQSELPACP